MKALLTRTTKRILAMMPPSVPPRVYNLLIKAPPLKSLINRLIRVLTPEIFDIGEGKIIFNKEDPVMSSWVTLGSYEPETVNLFRKMLKEGMTVVDIGANIGYYTVIAARRVGASGRVFAYEPDSENFRFLERNIGLNKLKNVVPIAVAISDTSGKRTLYLGDTKCTHAFADNRHTGNSESVESDTLDRSVGSYGSMKVDVIKMDIEGAEPLALEGMRDIIAHNPKLIIFTEIYPGGIKRLGRSPLEFLKRLKGLGFTVRAIDEDGGKTTVIEDFEAFIHGFPEGESFKNLYASR